MIATRPTTGGCPLPSATPSSANQSAKAAPPRSSTSLANRASRSNRIILPGFTVGSLNGLGAADCTPGCSNWPKAGPVGTAKTAPASNAPHMILAHFRVTFSSPAEISQRPMRPSYNTAEETEFTSTSFGVKLRAPGGWSVNQIALTKGSCVAYFSTGPYKATTRELRPSVVLLVKQPEKNETLEEFSKRFLSKGSFEPFAPSRRPAESCIARK